MTPNRGAAQPGIHREPRDESGAWGPGLSTPLRDLPRSANLCILNGAKTLEAGEESRP